MTGLKPFLIVIVVSIGAFAQSAAAPKTFSASEKLVSDAFTTLSTDRFLKPGANRLNAIQGITKLNGAAHSADHSKPGPKAHPALPYITIDALKALPLLETEYRKGDAVKAAYSTRRIMQFCSECHAGGGKPDWLALAPTTSLSPIEIGEFYKLSLKFDDALLQYEKVLNSPGLAISQPAIWEGAALNIVAIGIESSFTTFTYIDLISHSLATTKTNAKQRTLLNSWRATGKEWSKEREVPAHALEHITQARQLISKAETMNRSLPLSGFAHQARAMMVLRKAMQNGSPPQKAHAFLLAGEVREKIPLEGIWLHAEDYYEACIRVAPKGVDAPKCFAALSSLAKRVPRYKGDPRLITELSKLLK